MTSSDSKRALKDIIGLIACADNLAYCGLGGNVTINPQIPEIKIDMLDDDDLDGRYFDITDIDEKDKDFKNHFRRIISDLIETGIEVEEISIFDCGGDSEEIEVYIGEGWYVFHDGIKNKEKEFLFDGRPAFYVDEYEDSVAFIGPDPKEDKLSPEVKALRKWTKSEIMTERRKRAEVRNGFKIPYKNYQLS